jgi:hypothetical protein
MFSSSIHLLANDKISFFFVAEYNSISFIHLSVLGHLCCFHSLAIINSVTQFSDTLLIINKLSFEQALVIKINFTYSPSKK